MGLPGIGGQSAAITSQQSHVSSGQKSGQDGSSSVGQSDDGEEAGNAQQQAKVSVLKDSLETQGQQAQQLIEQSQGLGGNVNISA